MHDRPSIEARLAELGGVAGRAELLRSSTRADLERAMSSGAVQRVGWGRYALPTDVVARTAAREVNGTAILLSAAAHWTWRRKWEPRKPQVAVRRGRRVRDELRASYDVRWRNLDNADIVDGWVSGRERTVIDCAVLLPFDEALSIADSALRSGDVLRRDLLDRMEQLDPQLRPRVRRVLTSADPAADNPFESVLRAIALDVPGLRPIPQVRIDDAAGFVGRMARAAVQLDAGDDQTGMGPGGDRPRCGAPGAADQPRCGASRLQTTRVSRVSPGEVWRRPRRCVVDWSTTVSPASGGGGPSRRSTG